MLPQIQHLLSDLSTNNQKNKYGTLIISNFKIGESLMRFDIQSDLNTDLPIPGHKIVFEKGKIVYSFLSFSPKHDSKQYLEDFFANLGYNTERIGSNMETIQKKGVIISFNVLKEINNIEVELMGPNFSPIFLENLLKESVIFERKTLKYIIRKEFSKGYFLVSDFINYVIYTIKDAEVKDKLVINCLIYGLKLRKKENFRVAGGCLQYIETTSNLMYFRRILVKVQVKNDVINAKFSLLGRVEPTAKDFSSVLIEEFLFELKKETNLEIELKNSLKIYLKEINHNLCQGQFYWDKNLVYKTNYYLPTELSNLFLINNVFSLDLEIIKLHIPNLIQIIFKPNTSIENIVKSGKDLKIEQKFQSILYKLSLEEFSDDLLILKVLKESRNLILNNRFYYKKIKYNSDLLEVTYFTMTNCSNFSDYSKEYPDLVIQGLISLICELHTLNLTFKDKIFPLDLFNWYEERPVFSYTVPLHKILQINVQNTAENSLESCKNSLLATIVKHHKFSLQKTPIYTSSELKNFPQSIDLIQIPQKIAEERLRIFEQNKISKCIQYYGLCKRKNKVFLLASKKFETTLNQKLLTLSFRNRLKMLKKVFLILEEILLKNSDFCCFDLESFGQSQNKKLLLKFLAREEINPIFKAPEVIIGRSSRSSLIFSFGKLIEYCLTDNFTKEIPLQIIKKFPELERLSKDCCELKINRRITVDELKVRLEAM